MQLNWPIPSEFPPLADGAVHVWAVPLESRPGVAAEFDDVLSPEERARASTFFVEKARRTFVESRAALRSLLGRYLDEAPRGVTIVSDPNGKPRLASGDLRFNLAHSGDLALVALTRGREIGVDVELVRPIEHALEIAARNFHPAELAAVRTATSADMPTEFMRCWTRKEAILKALGIGLGYPLGELNTLLVDGDGAIALSAFATHPAMRCWLQDLGPGGEYLAAVATFESRPAATGFTYSP